MAARRRAPAGSGRILGQGMWIGTLGVAALLCLLAFYAQGGLKLETLTNVELGLTLASAVLLAVAVLVAPARRPVSTGRGRRFCCSRSRC